MKASVKEGDEALITFAEQAVYAVTGEYLNDLQRLILRESLQETKKTYEEIAIAYNYSGNYIQQVVGPRLWRQLSKVLNQKVSKSNVRTVLMRHLIEQDDKSSIAVPPSQTAILTELEYPTDSVPLTSPFYIQRQDEPHCYQSIFRPGALVRIKAPRQMGKTSFMQRMLANASEQGYTCIVLNFQQAERAILSDLTKFLRWFCANLTKQLKLPSELDNFWDSDIGSKMSCTLYMEGYILESVQSPMVLALEEVSELFEYQTVAKEFFSMLRTWHENTKADDSWQQLRFLTVQSTESYVPLNINQSPFNVGLEIVLPGFTPSQVNDLASRHDLSLTLTESTQLCDWVNGHPHLVRLFLYQLSKQKATFADLMATSSLDEGLYRNYLHRYLGYLQQNPILKQCFKTVIMSPVPIEIEQISAFQLQSMGLINICKNATEVSCELYQAYFNAHLN